MHYLKLSHAIIITAVLISKTLFCQNKISDFNSNQPEVGKSMPDFRLNSVIDYKLTNISLSDFRGKWLFLDFWFPGCVACIKSFPKINDLQKKFAKDVSFILIGLNHKRFKGIETLYVNLKQKHNLDIISAFDSTLADRWKIRSMPHIIIVDPSGIVRSITNGQNMTEERIHQMLNGSEPSFYLKEIEREVFDPLNIQDYNKSIIYQFTLALWNGEKSVIPTLGNSVIHYVPKGKERISYQATMIPLYRLYNLAFLGKAYVSEGDSIHSRFYPIPILELKNKSLFDYSYQEEKGLYNISLTLPSAKNTTDDIMIHMQKALKAILDYDVTIEVRKLPVWRFIANPGTQEKLRTKGSSPIFYDPGSSGGAGGLVMKNQHPKILFTCISRYLYDYNIPIFNETGLAENIDITIDTDMTSFDEVKKALQKNGMDLIRGEKEMNVIVIRDNEN